MDFESAVKAVYKRRRPESRKGDFGSVLVVGGNSTYSGAPALAAMAALRAGSDLTCIAAPRRAADIAASFSPDLITYPLEGPSLKPGHVPQLTKLAAKYDAVAIGNGLGTEPSTKKAVVSFLSRLDKPCVIDADAIKALHGRLNGPFVITPHAAEFNALAGSGRGAEHVKAAAKRLGCVILLKGCEDTISDGASVSVNRTGNAFMTKGGTGDTLAGICASLLARGVSPYRAACVAAYINGLAGDIAAKRLGEGMLATDVVDAIPAAIRRSS